MEKLKELNESRRSGDSGWRKFITVELTTTLLIGMFVAGGIWVSLSGDVIRAQAAINRHTLEYLDISLQVSTMDKDILLIAADIMHNKETSQEIKSELKEQRKDIKEILRVVHLRE